jgi:hypothetical protein
VTGDGIEADVGPDGLLRTARVGPRTAVALAHSPVLLPAGGRLDRAFCRYDPGGGFGWVERLA